MEDYYALLGVAPDADPQAIRSAWLAKAHRFHPDHNPGDLESHDHFIAVRHAYKVLSDPSSRSAYDRFKTEDSSSRDDHGIQAHLDTNETPIFNELRIVFIYTGKGKSFSRPSFNHFFYNSKPFVSVRTIHTGGSNLRETTFTYLIAPMKTGILEIEPASVVIDGLKYTTPPLKIKVYSTTCAFSKDSPADSLPVKCSLHLHLQPSKGRFPTGETKRVHTVLVPRSKVARRFHRLARVMKVVFTFWGAFLFFDYLGSSFLPGMVVGNLLGGLNVYVMYRLAKVAPRRTGVKNHSGVSEYLDVGYKLGTGPAWPLDRAGILDRLVSMVS